MHREWVGEKKLNCVRLYCECLTSWPVFLRSEAQRGRVGGATIIFCTCVSRLRSVLPYIKNIGRSSKPQKRSYHFSLWQLCIYGARSGQKRANIILRNSPVRKKSLLIHSGERAIIANVIKCCDQEKAKRSLLVNLNNQIERAATCTGKSASSIKRNRIFCT